MDVKSRDILNINIFLFIIEVAANAAGAASTSFYLELMSISDC